MKDHDFINAWSYGDLKKDRKGNNISFIGYSDEVSKNGNSIEFWEPEDIFLKKNDLDSKL